MCCYEDKTLKSWLLLTECPHETLQLCSLWMTATQTNHHFVQPEVKCADFALKIKSIRSSVLWELWVCVYMTGTFFFFPESLRANIRIPFIPIYKSWSCPYIIKNQPKSMSCVVTSVSSAFHAILMVFSLSCVTDAVQPDKHPPVNDVLDVVVDGLVISASVWLNMKGNLEEVKINI